MLFPTEEILLESRVLWLSVGEKKKPKKFLFFTSFLEIKLIYIIVEVEGIYNVIICYMYRLQSIKRFLNCNPLKTLIC